MTDVFGARRWRSYFWQGLIVLCVGLLIFEATTNAYLNLQRQGVAVGWGFLNNVAGFALSQTLIPYSEVSTYFDAFVVGLLNTLLVAVLGLVFATLLGFIAGVARLSHNWLIAKVALVYIEFIRNIPLVLQLVFWYRAVLVPLPAPRNSLSIGGSVFLNNRGLFLPSAVTGDHFVFVGLAFVIALIGAAALRIYAKRARMRSGRSISVWRSGLALVIILPLMTFLLLREPLTFDYPTLNGFNFSGGTQVIPELVALLLGLVLYTGAFIAEIVRAGIESVSKGQSEAAQALGLTRNKTMRLIVVPQALRVIVPPLTSQYLNLIKNSSLAVAIGYPELFTVSGTINNQTGQAIEVVAIMMSVYLFLSLTTSALMNIYNARIALVER